jgi:hypothetical protein
MTDRRSIRLRDDLQDSHRATQVDADLADLLGAAGISSMPARARSVAEEARNFLSVRRKNLSPLYPLAIAAVRVLFRTSSPNSPPQIVADLSNDDLSRIEAHSDVEVQGVIEA